MPVGTQFFEQHGRQGQQAFLLSFADDAEHHALAVDAVGGQLANLADAQASRVAGPQQHAEDPPTHGGQEAGDLFRGTDVRDFAWSFAVGETNHDVLPWRGYLIKEAQGGNGLVIVRPGGVFFVQKMHKILVGWSGPS
jgi:hypothetical protein